jgi:uncharacterized protein (DUF1330 family)
MTVKLKGLSPHALRARYGDETMPAYVIALNRSVHDLQKLQAYWKTSGPTLAGRGAKVLSVYTPFAALESMGPLEGIVLIEFPDMAAAKAWYESPACQKAKQHRDGAADGEFFIVDGGLVAPEDRFPHMKDRQI